MPNSPSQIIPYMLEWRQIWGSARQRKGSNSAKTVYQEIPWSILVYLGYQCAKNCLLKMAPGSRCRMSWTFRWAVMGPRINTRGDHVL
ncbi:hypothetical protein TNCV_2902381 [Trichonephila clavipes]|nr:hypothetical protein TNCV_2902381 [Trichonephila clavipes]